MRASFQELQPASFRSTTTIFRHVVLGRSLFLLPSGVHPRATTQLSVGSTKHVVNSVPSPLRLAIDVYCLCHLQSCLVRDLLDCFGVLSVLSHQSGVFSDPRLVFFPFLKLIFSLLISHKPSCAAPTFPRYLKSRLCNPLISFALSHLTLYLIIYFVLFWGRSTSIHSWIKLVPVRA